MLHFFSLPAIFFNHARESTKFVAALRQAGVEKSRGVEKSSEFPRRYDIEAGCRKVGKIPGGQAAAIHSDDRGDHAVGCGHRTPLPCSGPHDFPIGERCLFRQPEDSSREAAPPIGQTFFQSKGTLVGSYFFDTEGDLSDCNCGKRQLGIMSSEPRNNCLIRPLPQAFGNDIRVEENQRSMPVFFFLPSLITASRSMSSASLSAARRA